MHCTSCSTLLTDVLSDIPGVKKAHVDYAKKTATVEHDASVPKATLIKAIADEGYTAE
jgi:copper chaperone CopZ